MPADIELDLAKLEKVAAISDSTAWHYDQASDKYFRLNMKTMVVSGAIRRTDVPDDAMESRIRKKKALVKLLQQVEASYDMAALDRFVGKPTEALKALVQHKQEMADVNDNR